MRETLRLLYRLQQIDTKVLELERAAEQMPAKIVELESEADKLRTELGALHTEHDAQQREQREAEGSIREEGAKVQKWERRLQDIKTPREYQALSREVEQIKRQIRETEDRVVELMELLETRSKVIAEKEAELKTVEADTAERVRDLRQRQAKLNAEANQIRRSRDEIVAKLPQNLVERYQRLRDRRGGLAVALTSGSKCSGCNVEVRPQHMVEVRKLQSVEQCPSCTRILVLESLVKDDQPSQGQ